MAAERLPAEPQRPSAAPLPAWAFSAALVVIFLAPSEFAYTKNKIHGPWIGYVDVLAGLICLAAFLSVLVRRGWRELVWPPVSSWALLAVAALSMTQATQLSTAAIETVKWGLYLIAVYMLFANVLTDRGRVKLALLTLAASVTLVVLWGLSQYARVSLDQLAGVRAGFTNRNTYSACLAIVLPLTLAGGLLVPRVGTRIWLLVVTAVGLVTMLSGPLIWVTVLVLALVALRCSGAARWITLAALAVFVVVTLCVDTPGHYAAVTEQVNPYETNVHKAGPGQVEGTRYLMKRWLEWAPALRELSAHPALGVGVGNYQGNIAKYYMLGPGSGKIQPGTLPDVGKIEPDTNNLYLVTAGSMGFCGLAALIGVLGYFLRRSRQLAALAQDHLGRTLAVGLPAALLALIIGNLFTAMFVRGLSLVIVLLFALAEAGVRIGEEADGS
jgi:hypothetical protein